MVIIKETAGQLAVPVLLHIDWQQDMLCHPIDVGLFHNVI